MNGLVSLLPQPYFYTVQEIWEEMDRRFGFVRPIPYPPHISWFTVMEFPLHQLEPTLIEIAATTPPLKVRTSGIGVFSGEKPILYISVIKDATLIDFHQRIWAICQASIPDEQIHPLYHPLNWQPHITLLYEDPPPTNLAEILYYYSFKHFGWEMSIDNLAFMCPSPNLDETNICQLSLTG